MIEIVERQGVDTFDPVGRWDPEQGWVEGGDRFDFPNSEHYDEDMMIERFDGPTLFARPADVDKQGQSKVPSSADFDVSTEVDNDTEDEEPWNEPDEKRSGSGPTMATTLGVGEEVTTVESEGPDEDDEDEREKADRVNIDRVEQAPGDAVVQADVDEEGDVEQLYYEP